MMEAGTETSQSIDVDQENVVVTFPSAISHMSLAAAVHHSKMNYITDVQATTLSHKRHQIETSMNDSPPKKCSSNSSTSRVSNKIKANGTVQNSHAAHKKESEALSANDNTAAAAGDAGLGDNDTVWALVQKFENASTSPADSSPGNSILSSVVKPGRSHRSPSSKPASNSSSAGTAVASHHSTASATAAAVAQSGSRSSDMETLKSGASAATLSSQGKPMHFLNDNNVVMVVNGQKISSSKLNAAIDSAIAEDSRESWAGVRKSTSPRAVAVAEKFQNSVMTCMAHFGELKTACLQDDMAAQGSNNVQLHNSLPSDMPIANVEISRTRLCLSKGRQAVEAHKTDNGSVPANNLSEYKVHQLNGKTTPNDEKMRKHRHHRHHREDNSRRQHDSTEVVGEKKHHRQSRDQRRMRSIHKEADNVDGGGVPATHDFEAMLFGNTDENGAAESVLFDQALKKAGINLREMCKNPKWETVVHHIFALQNIINGKNVEIQSLNDTAKQTARDMVELRRQNVVHAQDIDFLSGENANLKEQLERVSSKLNRQCRENNELLRDVIVYRNKSIECQHRTKSLERRLTRLSENGAGDCRCSSGSSGGKITINGVSGNPVVTYEDAAPTKHVRSQNVVGSNSLPEQQQKMRHTGSTTPPTLTVSEPTTVKQAGDYASAAPPPLPPHRHERRQHRLHRFWPSRS